MKNHAIQGAVATVGILFVGLIAGLTAGDLVFKALPGSSVLHPALGHVLIAAVPALAGMLGAGALWGDRMGRIAGAVDRRRMAVAGMLGFAPITIVLGVALGVGESALVSASGATVHRAFTLLFVPSAFLIAGVASWALGVGLRDRLWARGALWKVGGVAAITFLAANLAMETAGWVVGSPGAAERATMIVVLAVGAVSAGITGGAMLGALLDSRRQEEPAV